MKRILLALISGLFLSAVIVPLTVFSQSVDLQPPTYSVHSPNVTSLGKYGDYPVDMSTGVPTIEIPLYTIKSGNLQLPISISYHASGIKVDQESSFIGLGWVLNAGGLITRILNDKKDETGLGFLYTGNTLPDYNPITGMMAGAGATGNNPTLKALTNKDKEPDLFNIVSKVLTGEFCLNNSGKFVSTNLDSLQYNVNLSNKLIIIKDRRGNIFRFGKSLKNAAAFETTYLTRFANHTSYDSEAYESSWHLTEMISADYRDTISFTYKNNSYSQRKPINVTRYFATEGLSDTGIDITSLNTSIYNVQVLDKILFKNGFLEFSTLEDRLDSYQLKVRITGFKLYDKSGKAIKSIVFDNADYFNRTAGGAPIDNGGVTIDQKKSLKLNSLKFLDGNSSSINEYKFEYDQTPLPERYTTPQDFWGYYNGRSNNSFIPQTFFLDNMGRPSVVGDDRTSNFNYMKAATLNKVIFPTGGYTAYEYEPNYYLSVSQSQNLTKQQQFFTMAAVNRLSTCPPKFLPNTPANNIVEFIPTENLVSESGRLLVEFSDFNVANGQSMSFRLTENDKEIFSFYRAPSSNHQVLVFDKTFQITRGAVYKFEARTNGVTGSNVSICNSPYVLATLKYDYWVPTTEDKIIPEQAGGLRVKTISNFDANDNVITKVGYSYGDKVYGADSIGVGELLSGPSKNFYNYPELTWNLEGTVATLKKYSWFSSDSQVELGASNGCPVFYNKVTEKKLSNNSAFSTGKTENFYQLEDIYYEPKGNVKYPYEFVIYPSWANRLVKTMLYTQLTSGNYSLLKKIEYEYYTSPSKRIKTLKIIDLEPDLYYATTDAWGNPFNHRDNPRRYWYYNFYVPRGRVMKSKEKTKEYVDGIESLVIEKFFDYNKYYDLSKEQFLNSKLENIETSYKYTGDLNYSALTNNFMVSLPVQSELIVNGKVRKGELLKYNDFGAISERFKFKAPIPVSTNQYLDKDVIPEYFEKSEQFTYDVDRKNIQQIEKDGIKKCYLWSYDNQHIVAEILNTSYSSIEATLTKIGIEEFSKLSPTKQEIDAFISPLKAALSDAQIITYEYKPLMGLASSTDIKGMTTYYEYDSFQRLKHIKDQNRNIVKSYEYHYKP